MRELSLGVLSDVLLYGRPIAFLRMDSLAPGADMDGLSLLKIRELTVSTPKQAPNGTAVSSARKKKGKWISSLDSQHTISDSASASHRLSLTVLDYPSPTTAPFRQRRLVPYVRPLR